MYDPTVALSFLLSQVTEVLDFVAPIKAFKIRPDKPKISLKKDTLAVMASRDIARKEGHRERFKLLRNTYHF